MDLCARPFVVFSELDIFHLYGARIDDSDRLLLIEIKDLLNSYIALKSQLEYDFAMSISEGFDIDPPACTIVPNYIQSYRDLKTCPLTDQEVDVLQRLRSTHQELTNLNVRLSQPFKISVRFGVFRRGHRRLARRRIHGRRYFDSQ